MIKPVGPSTPHRPEHKPKITKELERNLTKVKGFIGEKGTKLMQKVKTRYKIANPTTQRKDDTKGVFKKK